MREAVTDPVHFIGIGGTGMSGLAELCIRLGWKVQGSDLNESPMVTRLRQLGAQVFRDHRAEALGGARTVVYSSAIAPTNVELAAARDRGLNLLHRSDLLGILMKDSKAITVAGTHGKSTTSAMVTHLLDALGQDPLAATGGTMLRYGSTARFGRGELFVAEADESDGSFLKYGPYVGIVTNIDTDHMEYYRDQARLLEAFQVYLGNIAEDGVAIIGWDNALARQVAAEFKGRRLTYGFLIGSEVRAVDYRWDGEVTRFTAVVERDQVPVTLKAMGRHNVQNALCALAVARALELDVKAAAASLATFAGVDRRMSLVFEDEQVRIFDDYAHNPGKIAASVETLRQAWPDRPLHVVYQPHRFSRLETMYDGMLSAMRGADRVYMLPVYSAGETTSQDFSPARLAHDLTHRLEIPAQACEGLEDAVDAVVSHVRPPAVILTVGAGDVWKCAVALKDAYRKTD